MPSLEQESTRGQQAQLLLENPLFIEAQEALEKEILSAWENSPAGDEKGREKLYLMLMLHRKVKRHFESLVLTGEMARRTLADVVKRERL